MSDQMGEYPADDPSLPQSPLPQAPSPASHAHVPPPGAPASQPQLPDPWAGPYPAPPPVREPYPFWGYSDLLILLGLLLPLSLLATGAVFLAARLLPSEPSKGVMILIIQFLMFTLLLVALAALLKWRYGRPFWRSLAWTPPRTSWFFLFAGGFGLSLVAALTVQALGAPPTENLEIAKLLEDPASVAAIAIAAITLGPLFEELTFRGFLLPLLIQSFGVVPAIILSSAPFSLLHGSQYSWSWQHIVVLFGVSCLFGVVRIRTGSTLGSTISHVGYNLLPTALLLFDRYA